MNTIFIQIASYRDVELKPTLKDLIEKADYPDNLKVCIAWQHSDDDSWDDLKEYENNNNFNIIDIPHTDSKGACWARNKIQQEYNGEKYTLQLDSHHRFVEGWDTICISMLEDLRKKGHNKPVLTSYIPSYDPKNDPEGRVQVPWGMKFDRFIPEGAIFFLPYEIENAEEPIPARFYSGHFTFADGSFAEEVQHDPELYFHGEEISIAVRAWTCGYDLFHPNKVIAWHEYTRAGRTKQWDDDKKWFDKNKISHARVRKLLGVDGEVCTPCNRNSFGKYFLGEQRSLGDWEKHMGIKFKNRSVQNAVLKNMPPEIRNEPFYQKFKHPLEFNRKMLTHEDYSFASIIFEDSEKNIIFREDVNEKECERWLTMDHILLWKEYQGPKPYKWIIWPYSKSKGWVDKIEVNL